MDSRSSTPRQSLAGRLSTTTGNNRSSSGSISSRSTASRPRVCYVCEEPEQWPTKALVGCVTCKKLWHHNCHSPPITRDLGNLQKSFTCERCLKKVNTPQNPLIDTTPMSPPVSKRCSIPGCPKIPSKDPITGVIMCKNHSISEKHRLCSTSSRPKVAIKTARVDRSKVNRIQKPEDREFLTGHKRRRTSTKKSLDSTSSETTSRQSNTGLEKRMSHTIEANASMEALPQQLEMDREHNFVLDRYNHDRYNHDRYRSKTSPTGQTPTTEPVSSKSPKGKKQVSKWIEHYCSEDLSTSLRSWLVTQTNTNIHTNEKDWWLELRGLLWTAKSEKLIKEAIGALNKAIWYRMDIEMTVHKDIHPTLMADTRSMLQVKQGDIERATELVIKGWTKDTHHDDDIERQFKEWQACYHACGIIVPRDPEGESPNLTTAPILPDEFVSGIEDDHDGTSYEPPSPEPIMDLLDREEIRASQANDMEAPKETSTLRPYISPYAQPAASTSPSVGVPDTAMLDVEEDDYIPVDDTSMPPTMQLAGITLESAQTSMGQQMQLLALASQSPVRGLAAAVFDEDEDLYGASPPRPSASTMSLECKAGNRSSDPNKPESKIPEAPSFEPMDVVSPKPVDTSSSNTAPLAPNSLAGTGYTWEAPAGSLEAKRRARSLLPAVTARVDKYFPPPNNPDSEKPVGAPSPVANGSAKKEKKQKKKKQSKTPKTDQEFRESQIWAHIDPTKIYPRPRMTPEQLAAKRREIKANPPGKERKANFGVVFTERFKARRQAMGISIYHLNIREIDDDPEVHQYTKNLENLLNIEGIDNYEPFGIKGVEGICMREMVGTTVKEVVCGRVVERFKRVEELEVVNDDRRHILFTHFRGF